MLKAKDQNGGEVFELSQTDEGINWIKQFDSDDQDVAVSLIDHMRLVAHKELFSELENLIVQRAKIVGGRIGLYAEREMKMDSEKEPLPLFEQRVINSHLRAYGKGPLPIEPIDQSKPPEVGSEGLVSNLITQLCRKHSDIFFHHPGPDRIREKKIKSFFLVADFIGSGKRARNYLSAAWKVASVKSWDSFKLMKLEVVAFSGTERGVSLVEKHQSEPTVSLVLACPTVETEFDEEDARLVRGLCIKYDPIKRDLIESLGFRGTGALIAFAHGCPNNVPRILHKSSKRTNWAPLFPQRVTSEVNSIFGEQYDNKILLKRLQRMHETQLANGEWYDQTDDDGRLLVLLLASLKKGPRFNDAISRNTGLTIPEIKIFISKLTEWGWINDDRRLTNDGHKELSYVRGKKGFSKVLPSVPEESYYPQQLRAPRGASS